jgi:hypothetical protein
VRPIPCRFGDEYCAAMTLDRIFPPDRPIRVFRPEPQPDGMAERLVADVQRELDRRGCPWPREA